MPSGITVQKANIDSHVPSQNMENPQVPENAALDTNHSKESGEKESDATVVKVKVEEDEKERVEEDINVGEETENQDEDEPKAVPKKRKFLAEKLSCIQCSCGFNKVDEEDSWVTNLIAWIKMIGEKFNNMFDTMAAWFNRTFDSSDEVIGAWMQKMFSCVYKVFFYFFY